MVLIILNINGLHPTKQMNIAYGVSQGSIFGPLLFTLYISDLPAASKSCTVILYADDTALIYSGKCKAKIENIETKKRQMLKLGKIIINYP